MRNKVLLFSKAENRCFLDMKKRPIPYSLATKKIQNWWRTHRTKAKRAENFGTGLLDPIYGKKQAFSDFGQHICTNDLYLDFRHQKDKGTLLLKSLLYTGCPKKASHF